jgi:isopentenyl-diphosphate delta-isomerase type 1
MFANTCCSHPLYVESELIEENATGVKNAAVRKIDNELGITELETSDLHFITKIHYEAAFDENWGEHEIDWILFGKKDVKVNPNPSEVESYRYVDAAELQQLFDEAAQGKAYVAPWFQLIVEKYLFSWWPRIDEILANKGLPEDMKAGVPEITYLGTPASAISAKTYYPEADKASDSEEEADKTCTSAAPVAGSVAITNTH